MACVGGGPAMHAFPASNLLAPSSFFHLIMPCPLSYTSLSLQGSVGARICVLSQPRHGRVEVSLCSFSSK